MTKKIIKKITKKKRCECDTEGVLREGMACQFHPTKELPFVNHKPNKCECKNDLKQYIRRGKKIWLCSNCCMFGDVEV